MSASSDIQQAKSLVDTAMGEVRRIQLLVKQLPDDENSLKLNLGYSAEDALTRLEEARELL
ncbi:hypothetical protein PBI_KATHERINEG_90 [Gordonia phage KatherineG]|uniref:Uncharacterized protein n=1 Tax=Gordonia phage KatherineG TaxID=1838070 RepID=A0A166YEI1_9CAUD|nr:hypothetical protein BEN62_gp020 [Gordonia phage KatherineG]ANA87223.1 hypothetical protein PBI_KATHERINEG_90 [Gordonia phage KatherineG]